MRESVYLQKWNSATTFPYDNKSLGKQTTYFMSNLFQKACFPWQAVSFWMPIFPQFYTQVDLSMKSEVIFQKDKHLCLHPTCAANRIDNTEVSQFMLGMSYTASRPFLLPTSFHQWGGWGCTRSWEGTQAGQLSPWYPAQYIKLWEKEGRAIVWSGDICLAKSPLCMTGLCFPGNGWTPGCPREEVNELLVLLGLWAQLSLSLLNCLCLKLWVFYLLAFQFSPHPTKGEWASTCLVFSIQLGKNVHENILFFFFYVHC